MPRAGVAVASEEAGVVLIGMMVFFFRRVARGGWTVVEGGLMGRRGGRGAQY